LLAAFAAAVLAFPAMAAAQEPAAGPVRLGLNEALARALGQSEEVLLARARVDAADAGYRTARSAALPQLNTQLTYTRALRSVFQGAATGFTLPDSLKFEPDPDASLADRVAYL
jgi:outer membrane protein TolC